MTKIELKCNIVYKNDLLDHMSKMGFRYKSMTHFLIEAIEDRKRKDNQEMRGQDGFPPI